ncbi:thioredoxin domain-containing protein [Puia sp.]|uniref:thioredoxin domain-containing protein n=1 Tax=Puia sp. TaxID=2045100 RepID=UPI002F3F124D
MSRPNRLASETSPYLLQHAHNPVDWYAWGEEALETARREDKPILVSIGYAACHWCHVMERESFEDAETARFMNERFVNIKIDREERPDLDHIYMDAVQAMTGSGGWPLNVFLTPEGKPFYGGTYFPPRSFPNRNSWREVLTGVSTAFHDRRAEVEQQAENLTRHVATTGGFDIGIDKADAGAAPVFTPETLQQARDQLLASADKEEGGFGGAPKFPQTFSIRFLLNHYYFTRDRAALDHACLSLDKMIVGGIYDQLGGGFARYSTDREWLVPHFEKMLYDNALLITVLSEAYQLTHKPLYREAIEQSIAFIDRELSNVEGGFYSSLDADSEGIEGKYYIWDKAEIDVVLGSDAAVFNSFYGVTTEGNWEGSNILTRQVEIPQGPTRETLEAARQRLLKHRSGRVRPALDDKILLGWNALMNIGLSKAYAALGEERYREMAIANMHFIRHRFKGEGIHFYHHAYKGEARVPAFLDDYAALIGALLQLQEITGDSGYLEEARDILRFVTDHFSEPETGFFLYTHDGQKDILLRKREIYDGATPSGNSMMASNLLYLGIVFDEKDWIQRAGGMAAALHRPVVSYPGSFGVWATIVQALTYTIPEVVITGQRPENARKEFLAHLIPYRVFQSSQAENTQFPLLRDKPAGQDPLIFVCQDYACQLPVNEVTTAIRLVENVHKIKVQNVQ